MPRGLGLDPPLLLIMYRYCYTLVNHYKLPHYFVETAAYRNLLSGTMSGQRIPSHHDNEEDDTDDDVEKQYASTLSPRTPRDLASRYHHNCLVFKYQSI